MEIASSQRNTPAFRLLGDGGYEDQYEAFKASIGQVVVVQQPISRKRTDVRRRRAIESLALVLEQKIRPMKKDIEEDRQSLIGPLIPQRSST